MVDLPSSLDYVKIPENKDTKTKTNMKRRVEIVVLLAVLLLEKNTKVFLVIFFIVKASFVNTVMYVCEL